MLVNVWTVSILEDPRERFMWNTCSYFLICFILVVLRKIKATHFFGTILFQANYFQICKKGPCKVSQLWSTLENDRIFPTFSEMWEYNESFFSTNIIVCVAFPKQVIFNYGLTIYELRRMTMHSFIFDLCTFQFMFLNFEKPYSLYILLSAFVFVISVSPSL